LQPPDSKYMIGDEGTGLAWISLNSIRRGIFGQQTI
jgi:hypothetical protein